MPNCNHFSLNVENDEYKKSQCLYKNFDFINGNEVTLIALQKRQASTAFPCPLSLTTSSVFRCVHSKRAF